MADLLREIKPSELAGTDVNPLDTFMLLGQAEDRLGNLEASATAYSVGASL